MCQEIDHLKLISRSAKSKTVLQQESYYWTLRFFCLLFSLLLELLFCYSWLSSLLVTLDVINSSLLKLQTRWSSRTSSTYDISDTVLCFQVSNAHDLTDQSNKSFVGSRVLLGKQYVCLRSIDFLKAFGYNFALILSHQHWTHEQVVAEWIKQRTSDCR